MNNDLIKIEADLEKAITDYIREELNDNSYGIEFHLGFWYQNENKEEEIRVDKEGSPFKESKQYVPCVIEVFDGNILGLEGIFNVEYTVPITFQIRIDDDEEKSGTFFETVVRAINEVKNKNRGQLKRLKVEYQDAQNETKNELFTTATTTQNLTPVGELELIRGENYVFGQMEWNFDISKDVIYGNQVHIFLKPLGGEDGVEIEIPSQRIYPLEPGMDRDNTPESIQNFGVSQAFTIMQESEYSMSFGIIMKDDDLHWHLLKEHVNKVNLQELYEIKLKFFGFDGDIMTEKFEFTDTVIILNSMLFFSIGEEMSMSLSFKRYIDELPPEE